MKKLLAVTVLFTAFSFTTLDAKAEMIPDSSDDCFAGSVGVTRAIFGSVGTLEALDFQILLQSACEDGLITLTQP